MKILSWALGAAAVISLLFLAFSWVGFRKEKQVSFGVTFSPVMARQLGLDPRQTFDAVIDDLGARKVRLPVYWSDVEKERGKFEFGDYDYFINKAESAGAELILAVGRKLPRWPECHIPRFAREILNPKSEIRNIEFENAVAKYIEAVVNRYKNSPAVIMWQVENEPFFAFGLNCAATVLEKKAVINEIALVRGLDSRPIILTDSGERGWWGTALGLADILGITYYPQVWNDTLGVVRSPLGPGYYAMKAKFFQFFHSGKKIIIAEQQAEPWGPQLLPEFDLGFQKELMNAGRLREIVKMSRRSGLNESYFWGVEWWFWLKEKQGDSNIWDEAKKLWESPI